MFSSDIGHWDVTDIGDVVPEAYELVDEGLLSERDFRRFVFENPAGLYLRANPDFFRGTTLEKAADVLVESRPEEVGR